MLPHPKVSILNNSTLNNPSMSILSKYQKTNWQMLCTLRCQLLVHKMFKLTSKDTFIVGLMMVVLYKLALIIPKQKLLQNRKDQSLV
jgi:hypothetical protein